MSCVHMQRLPPTVNSHTLSPWTCIDPRPNTHTHTHTSTQARVAVNAEQSLSADSGKQEGCVCVCVCVCVCLMCALWSSGGFGPWETGAAGVSWCRPPSDSGEQVHFVQYR